MNILETKRQKLRIKESDATYDQELLKHTIEELRLDQLKFGSIFETIKSEIVETQNNLAEVFDDANQTFEDRSKILKQINTLLEEEGSDSRKHDKAMDMFNSIIEEERIRARNNEKNTHLAILKERKERRAAKQRANNTYKDKRKDHAGDLEKSYNRGKLSDEQEKNIRNSIAKLETEINTSPRSPEAKEHDEGSKERILATLHHLRHARRVMLLNSRQAAQHTDRTVATMLRVDFNSLIDNKKTVIHIVQSWKDNEKHIFNLVNDVSSLIDEILLQEGHVEGLKRKTKKMQQRLLNVDGEKLVKIKKKRRELLGIQKSRDTSKLESDTLKNGIDALCQGVENMLISTNIANVSSDAVQTVKPFSLIKFSGKMEKRALAIISAFRIWQEMTNDEVFMQSARFSPSTLPPLKKHFKFKTLHGPSTRKRAGSQRTTTPLKGAPLIARLNQDSDVPVSVKEMRMLFSK